VPLKTMLLEDEQETSRYKRYGVMSDNYNKDKGNGVNALKAEEPIATRYCFCDAGN
jgi:hypothetical protein